MGACDVSDHTPIVVVLVNRGLNMSVNPPLTPTVWNTCECNWVEYVPQLEELTGRSPLSEFVPLSPNEKVKLLEVRCLRKRKERVFNVKLIPLVVSTNLCSTIGEVYRLTRSF